MLFIGIGSLHSGDAPSGEDNDQLSRIILFEDVTEFLFSLSSEEARFSLICQFIDFYGGKISRWYCSHFLVDCHDHLHMNKLVNTYFRFIPESMSMTFLHTMLHTSCMPISVVNTHP